jgi:hypothetical protein
MASRSENPHTVADFRSKLYASLPFAVTGIIGILICFGGQSPFKGIKIFRSSSRSSPFGEAVFIFVIFLLHLNFGK